MVAGIFCPLAGTVRRFGKADATPWIRFYPTRAFVRSRYCRSGEATKKVRQRVPFTTVPFASSSVVDDMRLHFTSQLVPRYLDWLLSTEHVFLRIYI